MAKKKRVMAQKDCTKCVSLQIAHGVEYCGLRLDYPNWYSTSPIGNDNIECNWYKEEHESTTEEK